MNKLISMVLLGGATVQAANADFKDFTCAECKTEGGKLCLDPSNALLTSGQCCDPSDDSGSGACAPDNNLCAEGSMDDGLWDYTCPAVASKCEDSSSQMNIVMKVQDTYRYRIMTWSGDSPYPNADAENWHCKYKIET